MYVVVTGIKMKVKLAMVEKYKLRPVQTFVFHSKSTRRRKNEAGSREQTREQADSQRDKKI